MASTERRLNSRQFDDWLKERGMTRVDWAKGLKVDKSAVTRVMNGDRKLSLKEAALTAGILDLPLNVIMEAAGVAGAEGLETGGLELVGWVDGDMTVHKGAVKGAMPVPMPTAFAGRDVAAVRMQTVGTPLEAMDGTLVYFEDGGILDWPPSGKRLTAPGEVNMDGLRGKVVLVRLKGVKERGKVLMGVLKKGYQPGLFHVTDLAGRMLAEDARVEVARPVLWMKL